MLIFIYSIAEQQRGNPSYQAPLSRLTQKRRPCVKCSGLSGGCSGNWFLFHLAQGTDGASGKFESWGEQANTCSSAVLQQTLVGKNTRKGLRGSRTCSHAKDFLCINSGLRDWERWLLFQKPKSRQQLQGIQVNWKIWPNQRNKIKLQKPALKKHRSMSWL